MITNKALYMIRLLIEAEEDDQSRELPRRNHPLTPEDMGGKYPHFDPHNSSPSKHHSRADRNSFFRSHAAGDFKKAFAQQYKSDPDDDTTALRRWIADDPAVPFKPQHLLSLEELPTFLKSINQKIARYITHHLNFIRHFSQEQAKVDGVPFDEAHMKHIQILAHRLPTVGTLEMLLRSIGDGLTTWEYVYMGRNFSSLFGIYLQEVILTQINKKTLANYLTHRIRVEARLHRPRRH